MPLSCLSIFDSWNFRSLRSAVRSGRRSTYSAQRAELRNLPIFSVQDLSVAFRAEAGWKSVVRDVSFEIAPRETLAVVGEFGSGKRLMALSIMGLNPTASARISGRVGFVSC